MTNCNASDLWVKSCGCGRSFTASEWKVLPLARSKDCPDGCTRETYDDEPGVIYITEYRNCSCRSTLAMPMTSTIAPETQDANSSAEQNQAHQSSRGEGGRK